MAIVTATITVDFTANYAGDHRVCWRILGSGDPYDCTTIVNCAGGVTPCAAIFTADVNTTSCDGTVTFEGYVQATCEDELSINGRLPWQVDFVPNVVCQRQELLCARGPIAGVTPNPGGHSYDLTDVLTVVPDPFDTEPGGASIQVGTIGDGIINSITGLLSGGLGYIATEVLTIGDSGGAGAGATITIDSVLGGGIIDTFTLTTNGTNYVGPFTFVGGSGAGANFDIQPGGVDYEVFGEILTVTVIVPGSYGITPTVTIATGTGSFASLDVALAPCPAYNNIGSDCDNPVNVVSLAGGLEVGDVWATCITGAVAGPPAEYDVTATGCCIPDDTELDPCVDIHIENQTGAPQNVEYTECGGINVTVAIADTVSINVCAVIDGIVDPEIPLLTITNTGSPCV